MHNHLEYNYFIGNKKAMFYNLKQYYDLQKKDVFDIIPLTYHIKSGVTDPQYELFTKEFKRIVK
jgi:tubulin monoglycylase TTLL3/8